MSVIIGHASQDENKRISGGVAGDQTGKELCTRTWYAKNWDYVLRCGNADKAEKMAVACEQACANNNIGYDQSQRNTLRTQAQLCGYDLSKITTPCECDCSSFMTVCAECAGIPIAYNGNNAPTTSTMKTAFLASGAFVILTGNQYVNIPDNLRRGDILVKAGKHTVMVLSNGKSAEKAKTQTVYKINSDYTTKANLYIRETPFGEKVKHSNVTIDAQKKSHFDEYGYAILDKGTKVTCLEVKELDSSTWIRIPSGWICGINLGIKYIE